MKGTNFEIVSSLLDKHHKIKTIYDIGAHKGEWTKKYSKVFPNANFYMFEGSPSIEKPNYLTNGLIMSYLIKTKKK
tara:strand:+ start:173 stop:400 length:228 start_codon:yes stop_codon:yes gene_type:complete